MDGLDVPAAERAPQATGTPAETGETDRMSAESSPIRNLSVLLVGDDRNVADMLSLTLQQLGHEAFTAASVKEALEALGKGSYSLVICDARIRGMSGKDVGRFVKQVQPHMSVGLIADQGVQLDRGKPQPIDVIIAKPFSKNTLADQIAKSPI